MQLFPPGLRFKFSVLLIPQAPISGIIALACKTLYINHLHSHSHASLYNQLAAQPSDPRGSQVREHARQRLFLGGLQQELMAICTSPHTCLSVKWYWHSFFHSSLSSLSTWRSGATWPRLTRSRPSLSRCMMFSCKHNGRSVNVVPLKAGWKRQAELSSQEAENLRNPSLQHSYCFLKNFFTQNKAAVPSSK